MYIRKIAQAFSSKVKPLKITASSADHGMKVHSETGDQSWQVHNPLQSLLGALAGCEYSTLKGVTSHSKVHIKSAKFSVSSSYDLDRFVKGGKQNHLNQVVVSGQIQSTGSQQELDAIQKKVANACPVYQMLLASGVKIQNNWKNTKVQQ